MNCIVCSTDSAGHRVVIDLESAYIEGGFCTACEQAIFGECFTEYVADTPSQCCICGSAGKFIFIEWSSRYQNLEVVPDQPEELLEAPNASTLCRTHYHVLASGSADWGGPAQIDH
mgnify:CR=1 FL=1